ncbi:hypothetical protein AB6A40_009670 [Gnathostoma spinigerum]|uniref:Uncharacterized protein n=1 Tax=Gnathostoma spinigerum TaxID=75299 RepID=A0ABD6EZJ4_9BILA
MHLDELNEEGAALKSGNLDDDASISVNCPNLEGSSMAAKTKKSLLRQKLVELTHEKQRLEMLAKIAKPIPLPALTVTSSVGKAGESRTLSVKTLKKLGMVGRSKSGHRNVHEGETDSVTFATLNNRAEELPFTVEEEDTDTDGNEGVRTGLSSSSASESQPPHVSGHISSSESSATSTHSISAVATSTVTTSSFAYSHKSSTTIQGPVCMPSLAPLANSIRLGYSNELDTRSEVDCDVTTEESNEEPGEIERKRRRIRTRKDRHQLKTAEESEDYGVGSASRDEDYAMWLPPDNQKGDGKTSLNAKFAGRY